MGFPVLGSEARFWKPQNGEDEMRIVIVATIAIIGLGAVAALANEPYFPRAERSFQRLDVNKDGKLAPEELAIVVKKREWVIDANDDKQVSAAEIEAAMQKRLEKRRDRIMALMDGNKDGVISEVEMDQVLNDMFDKADTDEDGSVSLAEIQNFKRAQWRKNYLERQAN
jgi:Ca2+-binding EF-hand superfamily protein